MKPGDAITSNSVEETERSGEEFAATLEGGEIVLLVGDLGSGKTAFVRGLARGLGVDDPDGVSSPSYTLLNEYPGPIRLLHGDLYRLGSAASIEELAFDELMAPDAVMVIEWGERMPAAGLETIVLEFEVHDDETRTITRTK